MKSKIVFLVLCCMMLIISGCSQGGVSNRDTVEDYRKGITALDISFIDGHPIKEILYDSVFSVGLELHNEGAADIVNGRVVLSYDDSYMDFSSDTNTYFELEGRNSFNPDGEERAIFFEGKSGYLGRESFRRDMSITATACYKYETVFADLVCLEKPYSKDLESGSPVCTSRDLSSSGQGAPVVVSNVDITFIENTMGVKPFFDITVSHKGKGLVIHSDSYLSQCSTASSVGSVNKVVLRSASLSEIQLDCRPRELTLRDNAGKIRCTTFAEIIPERLPFEAPLSIELAYGYSQVESIKTTIVR